MKKILIILILTLTIITIKSNYKVEAIIINGIDFQDLGGQLQRISGDAIIAKYNSTGIYYIFYKQTSNFFVRGSYNEVFAASPTSNYNTNHNYYEYNISTNVATLKSSSSIQINNDFTIIGATADIYKQDYNNGPLYKWYSKNIENKIKLVHGSKYLINNTANTIMQTTFNLTTNGLTEGSLLVLDEQQNLIDAYTVNTLSGTNITINLPLGNSIVYSQFLPTYIDDYFILDTLFYDYLEVQNYVPKYLINGGSTVELNALSIPNTIPSITPAATTEIIYQWTFDNITYTKYAMLNANEVFGLDPNKNYLIKFMHNSTTQIPIYSNFYLQNTSQRISVKPDAELLDIIINNGGTIEENQSQVQTIYELDRTQDIVITNLKQSILGVQQLIDIYITPSSTSNIKISLYRNNNGTDLKVNEFIIDGTQNNKTYSISIPYKAVIEENGTGIAKVYINNKFKLDTDYTISTPPQYIYDNLVETEYSTINPTIPNIDTVKDGYVKPATTSLFDSLFNGQALVPNGITDIKDFELEINTIKDVAENVTNSLQIFITPIQTLFTAIPGLYMLIMFGFGTSLLLFILGR